MNIVQGVVWPVCACVHSTGHGRFRRCIRHSRSFTTSAVVGACDSQRLSAAVRGGAVVVLLGLQTYLCCCCVCVLLSGRGMRTAQQRRQRQPAAGAATTAAAAWATAPSSTAARMSLTLKRYSTPSSGECFGPVTVAANTAADPDVKVEQWRKLRGAWIGGQIPHWVNSLTEPLL